MFTGIIEEIGTIQQIKKGPKSVALTIAAEKVLEDTKVGDSIATNGVCLTVTAMTRNAFTVDIMHETLKRTAMHNIQTGNRLNLERALTLSARLGGHMVSGHIDGTGVIISVRQDDIAYWVKVQTTKAIMKYIIEKGSIAIDGISLTVATVSADAFEVSIIPHTKDETTLLSKPIGALVNLECDLIGKYVEKLLNAKESNGIDEAFLKKYGY